MSITLHFFIFLMNVHFSQRLSALFDVLNNQGLGAWKNNLYYPAVFMGFTQNFWNQLLPRLWVEKQQGELLSTNTDVPNSVPLPLQCSAPFVLSLSVPSRTIHWFCWCNDSDWYPSGKGTGEWTMAHLSTAAAPAANQAQAMSESPPRFTHGHG